jgi:hypothetical protein
VRGIPSTLIEALKLPGLMLCEIGAPGVRISVEAPVPGSVQPELVFMAGADQDSSFVFS